MNLLPKIKDRIYQHIKARKNFLIDIQKVLTVNILGLIVEIILALLIPGFLGLTEFGYFKIFTLYISYIGFAHLGFNDGIYIRYRNYEYAELPKENFRTYFRTLFLSQVIIAIIICLFYCVYFSDIKRYIIIVFVCINLIIVNSTCFLNYTNQITKRFDIFSKSRAALKLLNLIGALIISICGYKSHLLFIVNITLANLIILIMYITSSKDIIFGKHINLVDVKEDIKKNISIGFFIMLGNFAGVFITAIDRLFVERLFQIEVFSLYSFAVNMVGVILIFIGSISLVVYPYISRLSFSSMSIKYKNLKSIINVTLGFSLCSYFFLIYIVNNFLPEYTLALSITKILFPTVLYSASINVISLNYYKSLGLQNEYTRNNIFALLTCIITNIIAVIVYKSEFSIATATLLTFILWMLYSDFYFIKVFNISLKLDHLYVFLLTVIFISTTFISSWLLGMTCFILSYTLLTFIVYKRELLNFLTINKEEKTNETNNSKL